MPAKTLERLPGAAALLLGLGLASEAAAMDRRAPSATPPAGLASQTQPAAASPIAAREAAPTDLRLRAGAPATFRLPPGPEAAALRSLAVERAAGGSGAAAEPVLEIQFGDLQADQTAIPALRVFLGKPDASLATPLDDPHFVGAVSFFPLGPEGGRFTLPLGETLRKIGPIDPATADVTLIPVDLGSGAAPPFEVNLRGMGLQQGGGG